MKRVGKAIRLIVLFLLVPVFCVTAAWADILDDCDSLSGPGSYQNLTAPGQDIVRWSDPPDGSYLCQQSSRRTATALYRCSDAREVTVAIYSRHGSYAGYSGGELVRGGDELPLWYQSSTGEVYCDGKRMVYDGDLRDFVFLEEEGRPSGLVEYGLSVYCSRDGSDYGKVPVRLIPAWQEGSGAYWYEVYQADLKEGTRYLRLVLTDQSDIQLLGREGRYQFETMGGLSLASVEIIEEGARAQEERRETQFNWDAADENAWLTEELGTGGLPAYRPGEEEGPESLPWGPEENPAGDGPAFQEETGDRMPEEDDSGDETPTGEGPPSSSASKAPSQQRSSQPLIGRNISPEEQSPASAEVAASAPALRREVPLWRRITEPDAMTMLIISLILIVMGLRILWEDGGRGQRRGAAREERYARYTSPDGAPRGEDRDDPEV